MKKPDGFTRESSQIAKGVGILWLLFFHLFAEEGVLEQMSVSYRPFSEEGFRMAAAFGKICVAIFVVLSSYGITKGIIDKGSDLKESMSQAFKRFLKLMGGFVALYVSVLAVFGWKFDLKGLYGEAPQGILYFLADGLGLAESFKTPTLNGTWWYMNLAYALVLLIPFGACLVKKAGYGVIAVAFFIPIIFSVNYDTEHYLFSAAIGVAAAYGDWFEKFLKVKLNIILKWVIGIVGTVLCVFARHNAVVSEHFFAVTDALIAVFIIWTAAELIASVPVLRDVIGFIGKHSLNIFLVHSFFFLIVLRDVVYHFSPAGVTYLILLAMSFGYSVVLELLKHFIVMGYKTLRGGKGVTNE
ncbi:MAG: acyltransferase family protein [Lachnospiraceae bacterium]|nr:acyltransferase family protein [Lachnospiraceae bacterium]